MVKPIPTLNGKVANPTKLTMFLGGKVYVELALLSVLLKTIVTNLVNV